LLSLIDLELLDDSLPAWPGDYSALLFGRINNPEWKGSIPLKPELFANEPNISPPSPFGEVQYLKTIMLLYGVYNILADSKVKTSQTRAENAVSYLVEHDAADEAFLGKLPLGVAAPLREAMRTCQLALPPEWPLKAYEAVGRDDVAASARQPQVYKGDTGFKPRKDFIVSELLSRFRVLLQLRSLFL
jgi:anaphase-promoting complex subunit 1